MLAFVVIAISMGTICCDSRPPSDENAPFGNFHICSTTSDCPDGELVHYCDTVTFLQGVCKPCIGYCNGNDDMKPNCLQFCPSKCILCLVYGTASACCRDNIVE